MKDIEKIKNKISGIWNHTELEMADLSKTGLRKESSAISNIVNDVLADLEDLKSCSLCEYDVCESCSEEMETEYFSDE